MNIKTGQTYSAETETKIALGINDGTEDIWSPAEENPVDNAEGTSAYR